MSTQHTLQSAPRGAVNATNRSAGWWRPGMYERRERAISTRREFLRRSALGAAALGLAACSQAVPTASGAPAVTTATGTPPPKRGGVLTWAQWDANTLIDPANPSGSASLEIMSNVLDPLILLDDSLTIRPP